MRERYGRLLDAERKGVPAADAAEASDAAYEPESGGCDDEPIEDLTKLVPSRRRSERLVASQGAGDGGGSNGGGEIIVVNAGDDEEDGLKDDDDDVEEEEEEEEDYLDAIERNLRQAAAAAGCNYADHHWMKTIIG